MTPFSRKNHPAESGSVETGGHLGFDRTLKEHRQTSIDVLILWEEKQRKKIDNNNYKQRVERVKMSLVGGGFVGLFDNEG